MKRGYLALYRKIQDHPFYKEKRVFSKYEAWIDILMEAQHSLEIKKVLIGMKAIECGHGQSVKSLRTWGERWGWSAKKVSRFLKLLEEMEQICLENVTVTSRITILNYSKYDPKCHTDVTEGKHEGNRRETEGKHECPTDNNVKHVNHVNHDKTILSEPEGSDKPKPKKEFAINSPEHTAAHYLFSLIKKRNPNHKEPNLQSWAKGIDLMLRIDKRDFDEIHRVIEWCQNDNFWHKNILSTAKLREKYDQLVLNMNSTPKQQPQQKTISNFANNFLKKQMEKDNGTDYSSGSGPEILPG